MKFLFRNINETRLDIDSINKDVQNQTQSKAYLYKIVQGVHSACFKNIKDLENLKQRYKTLEEVAVLEYLADSLDVFKNSETKKKFKQTIMTSLLKVCYTKCRDDIRELLFFATATFNVPKLKEIVKLCDREEINQVRFSETVIIFTLKYSDLSDENLVECMKLVIDAGVDINRTDTSGKFAIDYVALFYNKHQTEPQIEENLKKVARLLLGNQIVRIENETTRRFIEDVLYFDLTNYRYAVLDSKNLLFYYISKNKIPEFTSFKAIRDYVDCDNGESTLLQFAVNKSQTMLKVVQYLLKNGADPNKTTEINSYTPLELAARNNYEGIFREILNCETIKIEEHHFCNFVKWRVFCIKREFFGILLESNKLNPTFVYSRTGNTPLHYAIRLCHKRAIQKLLKRPETSLTVRNLVGKCPLDIFNPADLNIFFDSCLSFDKRRIIDFTSTEYIMQFRFRRLNDGSRTEVDVISQMGDHKHLEHLLTHPLIHTYIMLKWDKVKIYFWTILFLQAFVFLLLSVFYCRFPYASTAERAGCVLLTSLNIVVKCLIFFNPVEQIKQSLMYRPTTLHAYGEILLMVTSVGSFFLLEFRAFVFVHMAILFLLTAGYHPKLARWSCLLQKVFQTFTVLLFFFSLLMIAFAAGFHIMFEGHRFFTFLYRAVFMSYFMTIGEINVSEVDFEKTPFGGYLLFFFFAMSMSVVVINFWTGVAIRDIDKFEKGAQVSALRNVIAFMSFVEERLYKVHWLQKFLPNPLLFPNGGNENYEVDFFPNKDDQFEPKYIRSHDKKYEIVQDGAKRFPAKLNAVCFDKIKAHYYKQQTLTGEQKMMAKIDRILNVLEVKNETSVKKDKIKRQISML